MASQEKPSWVTALENRKSGSSSSSGFSGSSSNSGASKPVSSRSSAGSKTITNKNNTTTFTSSRPDMSRNQSLAGQTVRQGDYAVSYDSNGYATSALNTKQLASVAASTGAYSGNYGGASRGTSGNSSSGAYVASDPQGVDNYYAKVVANSGKGMYDFDLSDLESYGAAWNDADAKQKDALAAGNKELADYYQTIKDQSHAGAETIRAFYGYSGGDDGSEFNLFAQDLNAGRGGGGGGGGYDLSEYLRQLNAAQVESDLANLKYAYETSMNDYNAKAAQLPQTYDAARNKVAAQNALEKKAFDERAAASGLSSGAAGQADLARSSAYQRGIANLDQAQANALSEIELQKAALKAEYENAIVQARSTGNSNLATALYQEMVRVQGLEREDAQIAQQMALEYGLGGTLDTGALVGSGVETPVYSDTPRKSKGYDNGSLTAEQVKTLQGHYGLAQDGLWGPNSQSTTGMSADEAWSQYLLSKYDPSDPFGHMAAATAAAQSTIPEFLLAKESPAIEVAAGTGTGYAQLLADIQALQRDGESELFISRLIANAQREGRITTSEAVKLQLAYGVSW